MLCQSMVHKQVYLKIEETVGVQSGKFLLPAKMSKPTQQGHTYIHFLQSALSKACSKKGIQECLMILFGTIK
jgi:hypothetical protein